MKIKNLDYCLPTSILISFRVVEIMSVEPQVRYEQFQLLQLTARLSDIIHTLSMLNYHLARVDCRSSWHEVNTIVYNSENVFIAVVPVVGNDHKSRF